MRGFLSEKSPSSTWTGGSPKVERTESRGFIFDNGRLPNQTEVP